MPTNYEEITQSALGQAANDQGPLGSDFQGSFLESWLYPGFQQEREFGQQVALQQMQNQWNSETEKMARAKAAGINVLGAGMQIAGDSAPSTSAPNTASGAGASAAGAITQGVGAAAQGLSAITETIDKLGTLSVRKRQLRSDAAEKLTAAGVNKWTAKAIAEMLPLDKAHKMADYYMILAQTDNIREEWHSIQVERERKLADIDKINEEKKYYTQLGALAKAQEAEARATAAKLSIDTWFREQDKAFREKYGFNREDPTKVALLSAILDGNDELAETIGKVTQDDSYNMQYGIESAQVDTSFDEAFNDESGRQAVKSEYQPYYDALEEQKTQVIELYKMILENPSDIRGIIAKMANMMGNIGSAMQVDERGNIEAGRLKPSHQKRKSNLSN